MMEWIINFINEFGKEELIYCLIVIILALLSIPWLISIFGGG